jgi:hypothetical protein
VLLPGSCLRSIAQTLVGIHSPAAEPSGKKSTLWGLPTHIVGQPEAKVSLLPMDMAQIKPHSAWDAGFCALVTEASSICYLRFRRHCTPLFILSLSVAHGKILHPPPVLSSRAVFLCCFCLAGTTRHIEEWFAECPASRPAVVKCTRSARTRPSLILSRYKGVRSSIWDHSSAPSYLISSPSYHATFHSVSPPRSSGSVALAAEAESALR